MFEKIKLAIQISGNKLDADIHSNIAVALADMSRVEIDTTGITTESKDADPLIEKCAELYCKWMYDYLSKGDEWRIAYEKLRDSVALCFKYRG